MKKKRVAIHKKKVRKTLSLPRSRKAKAKKSRQPAKPSKGKKRSRVLLQKIRGSRVFEKKGVPVLPAVPLDSSAPSNEIINDLPFSYNQTKLEALVRDPFWVFVYWDFSSETWNWLVDFRQKDHAAKAKLRVHNLDSKSYYDLDAYLEAKNWYIHLGLPDTVFEIELGLLDSKARFHGIAKSGSFKTPRNGPSKVVDPEWSAPQSEMDEIYRLSGGGKTGHGSEIFSPVKLR
jgi:uncharacterized protein